MFGIQDFTKPIIDFSNFEISQLGDAFLFGGAILLIGMITVFSILCILWLCLSMFNLIFHKLPDKRVQKRSANVSMAPTEAVEETHSTDDAEIIAVIAAAIAAAESEDTGLKFRVVSFRRV